jgi:hypothetical protein
MFDDNPVLKDRLMGLAAIGAAVFGGVVAVDVMVTGGLELGVERTPYDREQPVTQVRFAGPRSMRATVSS